MLLRLCIVIDYAVDSPEWELEVSRQQYIQSVEAVHNAEQEFHDAVDISIEQAIHLGEARKAVEVKRNTQTRVNPQDSAPYIHPRPA